MPLINQVLKTTIKIERPFHDDGVLFLKVTKGELQRIEQFEVRYKDQSKIFEVDNFNVLQAWKAMENWLATL